MTFLLVGRQSYHCSVKTKKSPRFRHPSSLSAVASTIIGCERCPRLRAYCRGVAETKRAAYRDWTYWGRPVPGFGDPQARVLILGLAPAAHGANRTGRVFTGDGVGGSGDFLMAALHRAGYANRNTSERPDDGLVLTGAYIAAAVRCAPPQNTPTPEEITTCLRHLDAELACLPQVDTVVALGRIAWDAWLQLLARHTAPVRLGASPGGLLSPLTSEHQHGHGDGRHVRRGLPDGRPAALTTDRRRGGQSESMESTIAMGART